MLVNKKAGLKMSTRFYSTVLNCPKHLLLFHLHDVFLQAYQTCHLKHTSTFTYPCNLDEEFNFNVNSKDVAHKIMMMIGEIKTVSNCLRFSSKDKLITKLIHITRYVAN